ncbi:MAG: ABC transporter substrate-binding protein [Clostridia bacterium]|nr:ABC transporter substrate-binding protein [Clostridia bacterium]
MKKIICIMLATCLVAGLVSCKSVEDTGSSSSQAAVESSQNISAKNINLLYSYSDTFNPYTATAASNRELSTLLYDSLIKTDNDFEQKMVLAQSAEINGKSCVVKLRNATFTDGSAVTANDVIYSYNLAKGCTRFAANFYEVTSVLAQDSKTVVFNLSQNDPLFANLLDFPIIKSGTAGVSNADGKEIAPIGCGRYYLSDDGKSLILNENYYGKIGSIKKINLINSPDATSTSHFVEVGATLAYYTDDSDIVRMSGKKTEVNLNRFVYIGINHDYSALQSKEIRYAISSALDRDAICRTAYYNNAMAANGFFNPSFKAASAVQTIESKPNLKITVENLAKIGYNNTNANGFYANVSGYNTAFNLLVNSENASRVAAADLIAAQCKAAGIQINVIKCTYAQYVERLTSGSFQLYLGEVQVLDNMDFSNLVLSGGSAAYGVGETTPPTDEQAKTEAEGEAEVNTQEDGDTTAEQATPPQEDKCKNILTSYYDGQCSVGDVASVLLAEMPQIPICYLNGSMFYSAQIKGGVEASSSDIYFTIENYEF